ncbi:hypothetical protein [Desulfotomaculum sp. 1211_IL3151]
MNNKTEDGKTYPRFYYLNIDFPNEKALGAVLGPLGMMQQEPPFAAS